MDNRTGYRYISDEEAHEIFKDMQYEAEIQVLEQKLKDMTKNRDWWRDRCKEYYEDYKVLADKLAKLFPTQGVKL